MRAGSRWWHSARRRGKCSTTRTVPIHRRRRCCRGGCGTALGGWTWTRRYARVPTGGGRGGVPLERTADVGRGGQARRDDRVVRGGGVDGGTRRWDAARRGHPLSPLH